MMLQQLQNYLCWKPTAPAVEVSHEQSDLLYTMIPLYQKMIFRQLAPVSDATESIRRNG